MTTDRPTHDPLCYYAPDCGDSTNRPRCSLIRQAEQRGREMERAERIACVCDTNPRTMDGPSEYCPQHGRPYVEAYDGGYNAGRADERKAAAELVKRHVRAIPTVEWALNPEPAVLAAIAAALGEGL